MLATMRRFASRLARVFGSWKISETPGVLFAGPTSTAGVSVTRDDALSLSAVFAAVNLLSRVTGSLPLTVYRRWGRSREVARTHPAYRLLHLSPNPEMTSATFRRTMEFHRLVGGGAYAAIQWAGNGKPVALWPIESWRVKPKRRDDGELYFEVDGKDVIEIQDMLHVPHVTTDGVQGRSFLDFAVESLGLGLATQTFAASYFGNGARPGGLLKHPLNPPKATRDEFRRSWEERHQGAGNASRTGVLFGGWDYVPDGFNAEQSQLIEQRRFTTEEVARWLGIPPHLLADLARATFSNIEQQNLDFLAFSLGPILTDYEQEYDRKLLSPPETYAKHNVNGLLRGDSVARGAFYSQMFNIGAMSVNDILEREDENPVDGGDVHLVPLNMAPLPSVAFPIPVVPETPPPSQPAAQPVLSRLLLEQTLERLWKVEQIAILRAAEKPNKFPDWLEEFYPNHEAKLAEALAFVVPACIPEGCSPLTYATFWCIDSRMPLEAMCESETPATFPGAVKVWVESQQGRAKENTLRMLREAHEKDT